MRRSEDVRLEFKGVSVRIGDKPILHDVCGEVHSGEILAVMGPSGSGKTTLLNSVAGRQSTLSGEVTLNGEKLTKRLRKRMVYVTQEDIFLSKLTLRETLYFSAMIQLPDDMPHADKIFRLQDILDSLDLNACQDTVMGDRTNRGLSGGERKRASIGCELLKDPDILLLDEPTTGLDSSMAFTLMSLLKRYTGEHNKTVLVTIHQPSSRMFYMFSRLMLMTQGKMAYYGQADKAVGFFEEAGLPCDPHYNPADFMLEVLKQDEKSLHSLINKTQTAVKKLREAQRNYVIQTKNRPSLESGDNELEARARWPTCFGSQYKLLIWRTFKQSRSRVLSYHTVLSTLILSVVVGLVWFQSPRTHESIRDRMGLIFFGIGHMGFVTIFDAVLSFNEERAVLLKERGNSMYRISAYYLAKLTSELPLTFALPVAYYSVTYWMAGLRPDVTIFFAALAILVLHVLNCKAIGFMIGPGIWQLQLAITVTSTTMVSLILLGGFYSTMFPPWLFWTRYLSVFGHTLSALNILEFSDLMSLPCVNVTVDTYPQCGLNGTVFVTPQNVLEQLGTVLPLNIYLVCQVGTLVLYFVVGYLLLRFKRKAIS